MSQTSNPSPGQGFPDETPRPVEASQDTPIERQENKLDEKGKSSGQAAQAPSNEKTMDDLQQERRMDAGDSADDARAEGPYGLQEAPEE